MKSKFISWVVGVGALCSICALSLFLLDSDDWRVVVGAWLSTVLSLGALLYCEIRNLKVKSLKPVTLWCLRCLILFALAFVAENCHRNLLAFILFSLSFVVLWFLIIHAVARWKQRT